MPGIDVVDRLAGALDHEAADLLRLPMDKSTIIQCCSLHVR